MRARFRHASAPGRDFGHCGRRDRKGNQRAPAHNSGARKPSALADEYAPEHLEVQVAEDELDDYLHGLRNYGSLFLGREATVTYGDKAVGTNHVLPTARAARYTGGLWVGKFLKTITYQRLTDEGTRRIAPAAAAIAEAEMFMGHAITAHMRLERAGAAAVTTT